MRFLPLIPIFSGAPAAGAAQAIPAWAANATAAAWRGPLPRNFATFRKPLPVVRRAVEKSARRARSLEGLDSAYPLRRKWPDFLRMFTNICHDFVPFLLPAQ